MDPLTHFIFAQAAILPVALQSQATVHPQQTTALQVKDWYFNTAASDPEPWFFLT